MGNQNLQTAAELFKPDRFRDAIDNQPKQSNRRSVTSFPFLAVKESRSLAELAELIEQADKRLGTYRNTSDILSRLDIFNHKPTMLNRIDTLERAIVRLKLRYNKKVLAMPLLKV